VATHQAQDVAKEKVLSLAAIAATADQQRLGTEEQCEHLVDELTLLSLRSSKLFITITRAPLLPPPLHEGMCFVAA
jgi:hypothetical protein